MKGMISLFGFFFIAQLTFAQGNADKEVILIRSLRAASNEALVKHDVDGMSKYWLDDLVLIRGNSSHLVGKDTIVAAWKKLFKDDPKISYVRVPAQSRSATTIH